MRQNAAASLAMDIGKYSHITPALYDLHWLPIHARIHFKILLLAFKVIHGQAPAYLSSLVSVKSNSLRSNCSTLLDPPKSKMLVTLGGRSFQAAVPQLWNALPSRLRDVTSVETFKQPRSQGPLSTSRKYPGCGWSRVYVYKSNPHRGWMIHWLYFFNTVYGGKSCAAVISWKLSELFQKSCLTAASVLSIQTFISMRC